MEIIYIDQWNLHIKVVDYRKLMLHLSKKNVKKLKKTHK